MPCIVLITQKYQCSQLSIKNFKGRPLKLTVVQLAGIGRSTVKGVGILAHEVGFGKTLSGILSIHEAMTRGNAKKTSYSSS